MKKIVILTSFFIFLNSCTHIELVKWDGPMFEVCCSGSCEQNDWDQKNAQVCTGSAELLSGENRSEIVGINTQRTKNFSHSQLRSQNIQCRKYKCSGSINPIK